MEVLLINHVTTADNLHVRLAYKRLGLWVFEVAARLLRHNP
jgi:hypothetical protein